MKYSILSGVFAFLFFIACSNEKSFESCAEATVAGLAKLSSQTESASFCRTIRGVLSYQYSGLCKRKGCFFLYDVDDALNPVKGDSIYLSDTLSFPSKWKDSSSVRIVSITGLYYPSKIPCSSLNDQECQRAFYVRDVE